VLLTARRVAAIRPSFSFIRQLRVRSGMILVYWAIRAM